MKQIESFVKWVGFSSLSLVLLVSCSTTPPPTDTAPLDGLEKDVKEIEEGHNPGIDIVGSGVPKDCVEGDERPVCKGKSRGLDYVPIMIRNESISPSQFTQNTKSGPRNYRIKRGCLRPSISGSNPDYKEILLDSCTGSKSVKWYKKKHGEGYILMNMDSGKCITRIGDWVRQIPCLSEGETDAQTWAFSSIPPEGSGDFIRSVMPDGKCMRANGPGSAEVRMWDCINDEKSRWYQSVK